MLSKDDFIKLIKGKGYRTNEPLSITPEAILELYNEKETTQIKLFESNHRIDDLEKKLASLSLQLELQEESFNSEREYLKKEAENQRVKFAQAQLGKALSIQKKLEKKLITKAELLAGKY